MVPVVNLWNGPERTQVVGRLSGNGRDDKGLKCQGAVVKAMEATHASGRTFIKIKSVGGLSNRLDYRHLRRQEIRQGQM